MTPFCSRSTFVRAAGKFGNLDINCDRFARIASFRPPRPRRVPCSTRCPCMHWMLVGACNRMLSPIHAIRRRMLGTPQASHATSSPCLPTSIPDLGLAQPCLSHLSAPRHPLHLARAIRPIPHAPCPSMLLSHRVSRITDQTKEITTPFLLLKPSLVLDVGTPALRLVG